jgi:hypothetical protein
VRYFHAANTAIFWGLFGLYALRRAARKPTWPRCVAAPVLFVMQLYSSLYAGMYFVAPLLLVLPATLFYSHSHRTLKSLLFKMGLATLAVLPLLVLLNINYRDTRRELGKENSYAYVSMWMRRGTDDLLPKASPLCQARTLGIKRPQRECRDELFPGRLVLASSLVSLLLAGIFAVGRIRKRFSFRWAIWIGAPVSGLLLSLWLGQTFPFHLGLWLALFWPFWRPGRTPAVRWPEAVFAATTLLVADIALNPVISIFGWELSSIHYYFYTLIPGFDGLRSEYRIVVLLPVFLSLFAAVLTRRYLAYAAGRGWRRVSGITLTLLALFALVDGQPAWQSYHPAPRTDRKPPVLVQAAKLPQDAVLSFVRGVDSSIVRREHADSAYWNSYIIGHRHRQITGKSTYQTPAANAIEHVVPRLRDRSIRLLWAQRIAYLFGGTHQIIDWRTRKAPPNIVIERMLPAISAAKLLHRDRHMALVDLGTPPKTTHGPVPSPKAPGAVVNLPWTVETNFKALGSRFAVDSDPGTQLAGKTPQRRGDWITFSLPEETCLAGVGFSPGLSIEGLPIRYSIEVSEDAGWRVVFNQQRWEVQQNLIDRPGSGLIVILFTKLRTKRVRLRIVEESPFPLSITRFEAYECSPT